jgi:hypothetical protein
MKQFLILLLSTVAAFGYESERLMSQVCPNRNSAEINTAITAAGTSSIQFGFDGGAYTISNNVTFPSNIAIKVYSGSSFAISSGIVMNFRTNHFDAPAKTIFSGTGTATGTVRTVYRWPEWGSSTLYNIGNGILGGSDLVLNNQNNTYSAGTIQAMALATVTNISMGSIAIDSWDDIVTLFVSTNSRFAGYPAITLTTNMITTDHITTDSTAITNATFVNAFDGNTNTYTSIGKLSDASGSGTYTFDLGAHYQGFVYVCATVDPGSDYQASMALYAMDDVPTYTANMPDQGGWPTANYASRAVAGANFGNHTGTEAFRISLFVPVRCRYFCISLYDADGSVNHFYKFSIIKAWGVAL